MQKELFAAAPMAALSETFAEPKPSILDRYRLNLRLDQTLVLMIVLLVVYVLVFSFGVETGKRYSMAELRAERAKRERISEEFSRKMSEAQNAMTAAAAPAAAGTVPVEVIPSAALKETAEESAKPAGRFTIQALTVTSKTKADAELKRFGLKGYKAFIIPAGKMLQICLGGFETREEANRIMRQLKTQRSIAADAYVRAIA